MQNLQAFEDWGLLVVSYSEPFSGTDLLAAARTAGSPGQGRGQHKCVLIDLRSVDVSGLSGADSRRFAAQRKALIGPGPSEPAAFLIRSMDDFGTIRMHNQWVEAIGLRNESDTLISIDPVEALAWLGKRTMQPGLLDAILPQLFNKSRSARG